MDWSTLLAGLQSGAKTGWDAVRPDWLGPQQPGAPMDISPQAQNAQAAPQPQRQPAPAQMPNIPQSQVQAPPMMQLQMPQFHPQFYRR